MNAALMVSAIIMLGIELSGAAATSDSNILQQQNHSFIALLSGNNVIPAVSTNATGIVKFQANASNINELYYEINLTKLHNDVARVDVYLGNKTENGRSVVILYQTTINPSEICCRSVASESERSKFFFNGTISTQNLEFGPLASSKNITDLDELFNRGNTYVEVDTYQPKSLSFSGSDSEIRGQIMPFASNSTSATTLPPVQLEPVKPQNDNQSNTTSVNEDYSTKYVQYEDTKKGFKIDHPQDWKAVSSDLRNNAVIAFNPPGKIVEVDVKLLPRTNSMSLKTFGDQYKKIDGLHLSSYYQNATTLLAGQPAIRVEGTVITSPNILQQLTGQGSTTHKILTMVTPLKQQKSFIQVIYFANKSNYSDYLPVVEHMLKSFQLMNTKPTIQKD